MEVRAWSNGSAALFAQVPGMECGCPAMIETNTSTLREAKS